MYVNIYVLKHPITGEIRYVGQTEKTLKKRFAGHLSAAKIPGKKGHCQCWIRGLLDKNLEPIMEFIEVCHESIWEEREKFWVAYYRSIGNICNHQEGGKHPRGHKLSVEHKEKVSNSLKGKKRPIEVKQKISDSHKGKIISLETREKLRQCNLGKTQSLKQRLKTSKGGILQIDPITNEIVKEYLTLGDIIKDNPKMLKGNIASACNGRLKTYHKFVWKYKKDMV